MLVKESLAVCLALCLMAAITNAVVYADTVMIRRAAGAADVDYADTFNRDANQDISGQTGDPCASPDTGTGACNWTEYDADSILEITGSTNIELDAPDDNDWAVARFDEATTTDDQYCLMKVVDQHATHTDHKCIFRYSDAGDRDSVMAGYVRGQFYVAHVTTESTWEASTKCGDNALDDGDYFGATITGASNAIEVKFWDHGAGDPGTDPGAWGAADCTESAIDYSAGTTFGKYVGIGFFTDDEAYDPVADDFEYGDI